MRDWLTKDLGWKIFSLFLAGAIWVIVHKNQEEPATPTAEGIENIYGNLPVHLLSAVADMHDYRIDPETVTVTVSGPPAAMAVLQADQIHAVVDLTGIEAAKGVNLRVDVSTPPNVTVKKVDPTTVVMISPPPSKQ